MMYYQVSGYPGIVLINTRKQVIQTLVIEQ